ncbi:DUF5983 family protein [Microbulbifer epialgicus]|uniref:DUF5983 domain-containing protein n=1 Tax=Microbulbifer epialgicus TaxID=393907 RepID=A0ABV4NTG8_9GAMM
MSKQILPHELAEIVTGLLVKPQVLGELESTQKHQAFFLDIGYVVAKHCGGSVNWVHDTDTKENYLSDEYSSPLLSIRPNECLPSLCSNIWSYYDPQGWEDEYLDSEEAETMEQLSTESISLIRSELQGLLCNFQVTEEKDCQEENYKVVAISTGHLSIEDRDTLIEAGNNGDQMVMQRDSGFFLKLFEDETLNRGRFGNSETMENIIQWAYKANYRMIELDSCAEAVPHFPIFDW